MSVTNEGGAPGLREQADAETEGLKAKAKEDPTVAAILKAFPDSKIGELKTKNELLSEAEQGALNEVEDEWDPFEDG